MKKKLLFLLPLLLMPLTACDMSNLTNKGDDDDSIEVSEPGAGEKLSFDKDEVANKLKTYGQTTGFDITLETKTVQEGETTQNTMEVAMKGNMVWVITDGSYAGVEATSNTTVTAFTSEDGTTFDVTELGPDDLEGKTPEEFFDEYLETLTSFFYFAEYYKSLGLTKVKDLTYVGRNASEYELSMYYGSVGSSFKTYVDKELGITLYFLADSTDEDGIKTTTEFKVTSFKSGDQVVKPNIH